MSLKERRRQTFLQKKSQLDKFTVNALMYVYGFSELEVQEFIDKGFIRIKTIPICSACYTSKTNDIAECMICGNEEFYESKTHYEYGDIDWKDTSDT